MAANAEYDLVVRRVVEFKKPRSLNRGVDHGGMPFGTSISPSLLLELALESMSGFRSRVTKNPDHGLV